MPLLLAGGAVCNTVTAQDSFTPLDVYYGEGNINVLELLAVKYGLQSFASIIKNRQILVRCDNSTAVSYISNACPHTPLLFLSFHCFCLAPRLLSLPQFGWAHPCCGMRGRPLCDQVLAHFILSIFSFRLRNYHPFR